jgi:hypothetical protein
MMSEKSRKVIGLGMMVPLPILAIFILLSKSAWILVLLAVVFTYLFNLGFKVLRGATWADVKDDVIDDIEDAKEDLENLGDRIRDDN